MAFQIFTKETFCARYDLKSPELDAVAGLLELKPDGPWLVGGCVRRLISSREQDSDFDVGVVDLVQFEAAKAKLQAAGFKEHFSNQFHTEYRGKLEGIKTEVRIQLLAMFHPNLESLLDSFDFTICQFGYDGTMLVAGEYSLFDIARKRLALHKLTYGASTVRRLTKYMRQGFTACQGTIVSILEATAKDPATIHGEVTYVD
jgi:hypothetical protein